jgi:molybdopterin-containing oxidoreductase family membrane subunit
MFVAGLMIVIGAWFKRYLIVTPTLLHPILPMQDVPAEYHYYFPSWEEWAIAIGSLSGALLIITFFARIYPIVPVHDTITERAEAGQAAERPIVYRQESEYYEQVILTTKKQE